jgi:uncharacterized protein YkwD
MRRLLPLLVLSAAIAVSGGCASTASPKNVSAAIPNWVEPSTGSAAPSTDPSGSGYGNPSASASASAPASKAPAPKASGSTKPAPPPAGSGLVQQLLAQVNELRASHGLPAYKLSNGLIASAHAHNLQMLKAGCGLSHRCPGEMDLGPRIKAQGVNWHSAGENIGYSGPYPNTQAAILSAAKGITMSMYNEKPPNDGHRKNILSSGFTIIGIDVVRDDKGVVWMTQDFAS